jgi:hypothetical protein
MPVTFASLSPPIPAAILNGVPANIELSDGADPEDALENELTYDFDALTDVIVTLPDALATPRCTDFIPPPAAAIGNVD